MSDTKPQPGMSWLQMWHGVRGYLEAVAYEEPESEHPEAVRLAKDLMEYMNNLYSIRTKPIKEWLACQDARLERNDKEDVPTASQEIQ